jgi:Uncharacterised methyltransferase family (DUF6094)
MSGGKMRLEGKVKLGFYPLPVTEAGRIRRFLRYPENSCAAIDPCIGDGIAFAAITREAPVLRYGIELDAYRAEQARAMAHEVIHGSAFDVHCSVESVSLLYLNPPLSQRFFCMFDLNKCCVSASAFPWSHTYIQPPGSMPQLTFTPIPLTD